MERKRRLPSFSLTWATLWLAFTAGAYLLGGDGLAAFTIFPAWTWIGVALIPLLLRPRKWGRRVIPAFLAVSIVLALFTTEEWRSLARRGETRPPKSIRIITLNCASLSTAAQEVIAFKPDIVLFSENPGRIACEEIAKKMFGPAGQAVVGLDGAIVSRYPLTPIDLPRGTHNFAAAYADIGGRSIGLIALRLQPPMFNIALYSPEAWKSVADNRRSRREEIAQLAAWVGQHPKVRLMAGDYNAQPWDASLNAMPADFTDAFAHSGTGWGHTAVNDYPLARIDQIWTKDWKPIRVWASRTEHSDHRMVIGDFQLPDAF